MAPTFRQLQYFVALSEELNFKRAARRLNMSQPPLSAAIRQLEEDLGVRLFERDSKHVSLTAAGKAFGGRAQRLLGYLDETLEITRRAADGAVTNLRIGFVPSMIFRRLPDFMREFEDRHPTARLTLHEMNSAAQFEALMRGQIDIGFIHGLPLPDGVDSILLMEEPFICCLPANHRLAQAPFVALRELAQERLIIFSRPLAPHYHDRILSFFHSAQVQPQIVHEVNHWLTILALVAKGIGVALAPQSLAHSKFADVAFLSLEQNYGQHEARCVWMKSTDNKARDLMMDVVRDVLQIESAHDDS